MTFLSKLFGCRHPRAQSRKWLSEDRTPMVETHCPDCGWYDYGHVHADSDTWLDVTVTLKSSEDGGFTATISDRPGCISEGDTVPEALRNLAEAVEVWDEGTLAKG